MHPAHPGQKLNHCRLLGIQFDALLPFPENTCSGSGKLLLLQGKLRPEHSILMLVQARHPTRFLLQFIQKFIRKPFCSFKLFFQFLRGNCKDGSFCRRTPPSAFQNDSLVGRKQFF